MKLGIKCQQCGCDEFEKQPVFNDWYCVECERDVGEITDRMKADKAVIEAAFEWLRRFDNWSPPDPIAKFEFENAEAKLQLTIEDHPDYKEELEGE